MTEGINTCRSVLIIVYRYKTYSSILTRVQYEELLLYVQSSLIFVEASSLWTYFLIALALVRNDCAEYESNFDFHC